MIKMISIVDFEQVTVNRYLKRKRTLTKKFERSTINAGFNYRLSHGFPKRKIYNYPDDGIYNFSKNDFFLLFLSRMMYRTKGIKCSWDTCSTDFFEAYMIVILQNFVKKLSALDYVLLIMNCVPPFAIYTVLLQSTSKIV